MIEDFIQLQAALMSRGYFIGRNIVQWKHFSVRDATVVNLFPDVAKIDSDWVTLSLGATKTENILLQVPTPLFETGTIGDIRTWVSRQNKAYLETANKVLDAQRDQEIALLRELKAKYPEELFR